MMEVMVINIKTQARCPSTRPLTSRLPYRFLIAHILVVSDQGTLKLPHVVVTYVHNTVGPNISMRDIPDIRNSTDGRQSALYFTVFVGLVRLHLI